MSEPSKTEKIIGKIQQLRKIAESTHSKAEKETSIALAAKLIAEYQLSEAELVVKEENGDETIDVTGEHIIYETGRTTAWKASLAAGLAELNGLFLFSSYIRGSESHKRATRYRLIGRPSDIEICRYMFDFLVMIISGLANVYVPTSSKRGKSPQKESYSLGCVQGFLDKMQAEREAVNKAATTTALVFIGNKAKEAEDAFNAANPKMTWTKGTPSKMQIESDNYSQGYTKGQTLSVAGGLPSSNKPNQLS